MVVKTVKRIPTSGSYAIAYAVKQLDVDVVSAYPITPSTGVVEKLADYVSNGELKAEYIAIESEHSAISAALAAEACGARAFTVTCSQGLLLMHEILFITSVLRLPVVMAVANRAVSAPINIWNDHSDAMAQRDTGWIQFFVENVQEAYDKTIQAYKVGEDPRVRLPVMVNFDGYILTHTYEPLTPLEDEEVKSFAPRVNPPYKLDPKQPLTVGAIGNPEYYYEAKYQSVKAVEDSLPVIKEVDEEFAKKFGRSYGVVTPYMLEDAEVALVSLGAISGTVREAVRMLRAKGEKVGSISLRLFRPFPHRELIDLLDGIKAVGVVDRAFVPGAMGGPVYLETAASLFFESRQTPLINFIAGIGGRDVSIQDVISIYDKLLEAAKIGRVEKRVFCVGLRE